MPDWQARSSARTPASNRGGAQLSHSSPFANGAHYTIHLKKRHDVQPRSNQLGTHALSRSSLSCSPHNPVQLSSAPATGSARATRMARHYPAMSSTCPCVRANGTTQGHSKAEPSQGGTKALSVYRQSITADAQPQTNPQHVGAPALLPATRQLSARGTNRCTARPSWSSLPVAHRACTAATGYCFELLPSAACNLRSTRLPTQSACSFRSTQLLPAPTCSLHSTQLLPSAACPQPVR